MVGGGGIAYLTSYNLSYISVSSLLPSHPPLLAPNPSLKPMSRSGSGPKALRLVLIE
jgi:hypothetical protein